MSVELTFLYYDPCHCHIDFQKFFVWVIQFVDSWQDVTSRLQYRFRNVLHRACEQYLAVSINEILIRTWSDNAIRRLVQRKGMIGPKHFYNLFFPIFVLQLITFTISALNPLDDYADIINIILLTLLTLVAFRYSLSDVLP